MHTFVCPKEFQKSGFTITGAILFYLSDPLSRDTFRMILSLIDLLEL